MSATLPDGTIVRDAPGCASSSPRARLGVEAAAGHTENPSQSSSRHNASVVQDHRKELPRPEVRELNRERKIGRTFLFQVEQINAASPLALFRARLGPPKAIVGKTLVRSQADVGSVFCG
jgi:hypothetical protein